MILRLSLEVKGMPVPEQTQASLNQLLKWAKDGHHLCHLGLITQLEPIPDVDRVNITIEDGRPAVFDAKDVIAIDTHLVITFVKLTAASVVNHATTETGLFCWGQFMSEEEGQSYIKHQMPDHTHYLVDLSTGQYQVSRNSPTVQEPFCVSFSCWLDRTGKAYLERCFETEQAMKQFNDLNERIIGTSCGVMLQLLARTQPIGRGQILDLCLYADIDKLLPLD